MQETIKLMADYECFPLWKSGSGGTVNVDPETLPLSAGTKTRLTSWAEWYDSTLNLADPALSGFAGREDEMAFEEEGRYLYRILLKELNGTYNVLCFSGPETGDIKEEAADAANYEVQRIYGEIAKLTVPEKMILVSKLLPELSAVFSGYIRTEQSVSQDSRPLPD